MLEAIPSRRAVLASMGAASVAHAAPTGAAFPAGFLWGTATAAHQVEGNNVNSDGWAEEHVPATAFKQSSGDAANSFELWPLDMDLMQRMGLNSYRFSLEWARIEPSPGEFSIAMLDHYRAMIEGCRRRNMTPVVTFNHFTTPRWFAMRGGWMNPESPALFARFCDRAARHLSTHIGYATTLNEPNLAGVLDLVLPPSMGAGAVQADRRMSESAARTYGVPLFLAGNALWIPDVPMARAHMLQGHAQGRQAIKAVRRDLPVGVSLAIIDDQAAGPDSLRDAMRQKLYQPWLEAAKGDDFVGVQNYERTVWTKTGKLPPPPRSVVNQNGSEVYPASLAEAARYAHAVAKVPVMVTEHGVNSEDDRIRAWLIPAALKELKRAMDEGVPVLGYHHWSFVDNFEWMSGYAPKFGLHSFDHTTFVRTPKPSAGVLSAIARANAV